MTLEDRGLKVGLIKAGPSEIELLEPISEDSTVGRFLDRRGPGLHHICFEVEDIEKTMRYYEGKGGSFLDPVPTGRGRAGLVHAADAGGRRAGGVRPDQQLLVPGAGV